MWLHRKTLVSYRNPFYLMGLYKFLLKTNSLEMKKIKAFMPILKLNMEARVF
jgi:hypothetical protein